ncbi:hypothetical protein R0K04_19380, partial [Pseudoalteromonas sp. SIMBA_153]
KNDSATNADMLLLLRTFLGAERAQQLMQYYQRPENTELPLEAVAEKPFISFVQKSARQGFINLINMRIMSGLLHSSNLLLADRN